MYIIKTATSDGLKLTGFLSEPDIQTKKIIIHIHGMAGSPYDNDWYTDFHALYPKNGYAFLAGRLRWTGVMTDFCKGNGYEIIGSAFEIFEECTLDIDAWVSYARQLGYTEIILQSHSLGTSKAVFYAQKSPNKDIKALVLISPVDMLGLTQNDANHKKLFAEATVLMQAEKPRQILSEKLYGDSYLSAETYVNLFSPESNANIFCYTSRSHDWSIVNSLNIAVLLIGGTQDGAMESVKETTESFRTLHAQFLNSPKISERIYEWAEHSFNGYADRVVADVAEFLR